MMVYTRIGDCIVTRMQQESKARERIRAMALTAFFTCFVKPGVKSIELRFRNIKRWYSGGYLNGEQIRTLYDKGVITYREGEAITGEDWGYELTADEGEET